MKRNRIMVQLFIVCSGFLLMSSGCGRSYRITESFTFTSKTQRADVCLGVLLPVGGPYQEVSVPQIQWPGTVSKERVGNVEILKMQGHVSAGDEIEAKITYDVNLRTRKLRWQAPVEPRHLAPQKDIESEEPVLVEKAHELVSGTSRKDVYRIYKFVGQHCNMIKKSRVGGNQSALTAYETGMGVCGDYSNLMVGLCRAAGIPSQTSVGLTLTKPFFPGTSATAKWGHPGISHGWVEFHTDEGWEAVDASLSDIPVMRKLFFNSQAHLLFYGEKKNLRELYDRQVEDWAKSNGQVIGSMSSPVRFAAARQNGDAYVTPEVKVKKRWFHFKP